MALRVLIKDQIIRIDDHKRGSREIKNWDNLQNDIHLDKSTNFKVRQNDQIVRIKIPINTDKNFQINIENCNKKINEIPSRLRKEIQKALNNKDTLNSFMSDLLNVLENFGSALKNKERARDILIRLSKHFELNWKGDEIVKYVDEELISYMQKYEHGKYYARIDKQKIEIGRNNGKGKRKK